MSSSPLRGAVASKKAPPTPPRTYLTHRHDDDSGNGVGKRTSKGGRGNRDGASKSKPKLHPRPALHPRKSKIKLVHRVSSSGKVSVNSAFSRGSQGSGPGSTRPSSLRSRSSSADDAFPFEESSDKVLPLPSSLPHARGGFFPRSGRQGRSSSWESQSSLYSQTEACLEDFRAFLFTKDSNVKMKTRKAPSPRKKAVDELDFDLNGLAEELDSMLENVEYGDDDDEDSSAPPRMSRADTDEPGMDEIFAAAANASATSATLTASSLRHENRCLQQRISALEKLIAERDHQIEVCTVTLKSLASGISAKSTIDVFGR